MRISAIATNLANDTTNIETGLKWKSNPPPGPGSGRKWDVITNWTLQFRSNVTVNSVITMKVQWSSNGGASWSEPSGIYGGEIVVHNIQHGYHYWQLHGMHAETIEEGGTSYDFRVVLDTQGDDNPSAGYTNVVGLNGGSFASQVILEQNNPLGASNGIIGGRISKRISRFS